MFKIIKKSKENKARVGVLKTARGEIETPVFMPVGTQGSVKAVSSEELYKLQVPVVLANTYHLYIRPGIDIISRAGGLHSFMNWEKPILTDSGGYQVFSLADLREVTDEGVHFRSHVDGTSCFFNPEKVLDIQRIFKSDICMVLDECLPYPCEKDYAKVSMERTLQWAQRSITYWEKIKGQNDVAQYIFGIIQGSTYPDLRKSSARLTVECGFDGYAVGGISVGEPKELMHEAVNAVVPEIPEKYPRYLMGIGTPEDMWDFVEEGIDMFDCVIPTRNARKGQVFTFKGKYNVRNSPYKNDHEIIEPGCRCPSCSPGYTKAYINHLFRAEELLAPRLTTLHNLHFMIKLLELIRKSIQDDTFIKAKKEFLTNWKEHT